MEEIILERKIVPQWLINQMRMEGKDKIAKELEEERNTWIPKSNSKFDRLIEQR